MRYISQADICWQDSSTVAGRAKDDPQEWYEFYRFSPSIPRPYWFINQSCGRYIFCCQSGRLPSSRRAEEIHKVYSIFNLPGRQHPQVISPHAQNNWQVSECSNQSVGPSRWGGGPRSLRIWVCPVCWWHTGNWIWVWAMTGGACGDMSQGPV